MKEIVTFLAFDGNCREVMEFHKKGKVTMPLQDVTSRSNDYK